MDQPAGKTSWKMALFARVRWLIVKLGLSVRFATTAASIANSPRTKAKAFHGYTPTAHDVFVCVAGKSGTNWMLQIVAQLAHHGRADFDHIHDITPWPDSPIPGIVALDVPTHQQAAAALRPIKTHLEADYVPYSTASKYIVVIRDPKDAAVSGYYFNESMFPGMMRLTMAEWVDIFVSGRSIYGSWSQQVASFWAWRGRDNVLILFYEEMKQDSEAAIQQVADFLEIPVTPETLSLVVEKSSFSYMKKHNAKFAPPIPSVGSVPSPLLVRSGRKGDHKQTLSVESQQKIDQEMQAQLLAAGSDFPYERFLT